MPESGYHPQMSRDLTLQFNALNVLNIIDVVFMCTRCTEYLLRYARNHAREWEKEDR